MPLAHLAPLVIFIVVGLAVSVVAGRATGTLWPTVTAFVLRCAAALVLYSVFGLFAPDAVYYDSTAQDLVAGGDPAISAGKEGWPYLLAGIYGVFGDVPQLGLVVGAAFASSTVPVTGRIAELLQLPKLPAAWFAALFPMTIVWGSLLLRESLSWFFLATSALALVGIVKASRRWPYVVLFLVSLVALSYARGPSTLVIGVAGVVALALTVGRRRLISLAAVTAAVLAVVALTPLRDRILDILVRSDLESIDSSKEVLAMASTGWPIAQSGGFAGVLESVGIAAPRVLFGPYPWEWLWVPLPLVADVVLWLLVLGLSGYGIWSLARRRDALLLLLPAAAILASLTIGSANYGTMQRLRVQAVVFLVPLAAAGLVRLLRVVRDRRGRDRRTDAEALAPGAE